MTRRTDTDFLTKRLYGFEHEYAVHVVFEEGVEPVAPEQYLLKFFRPFGLRTAYFTSNGARVYLDGSHPEWATPENCDVRDLVTHVRAGDLVMEELAVRLELQLAAEGTPGRVFLFKNNTDSVGNSYGAHENYLTLSRLSLRDIGAALLPFLVTRQLIAGSGGLQQTATGPAYVLSPRAFHIDFPVGDRTREQRAAITANRGPLTGDPRYQRLHVVVGDSNMSDTTTALKIGTTDLVLRMIEAGHRFPELQISYCDFDLASSFRAVSADLTGRGAVRMLDGSRRPAIEIQQAYLEHTEKFAAAHGFAADAATTDVLEPWGRTLEAVRSGNLSQLNREIDWVIKKELLERFCARKGVDLSHPKIADIALRYHDLRYDEQDPKLRGIFRMLERQGLVSRLTDDAEILTAVSTPPPTQAAVRGNFVKWVAETQRNADADWEVLYAQRALRALPDPRPPTPPGRLELPAAVGPRDYSVQSVGTRVTLKDPFATTDTDATRLMQQSLEQRDPQPHPAAVQQRSSAAKRHAAR